MTRIETYLTFNGNCRQAMSFYQQCLGGELAFQTIGESPLGKNMPRQMKEYILHSTLTRGPLVLMGSDMVSERGLKPGNSVSLCLQCSSEAEMRVCFERLSEKGMPAHPPEVTFWGALFGGLIDQFGNHWLLNYDKNQIG